MRSIERNPRTKKEEKIVGGSFDKKGDVIEDQSLVPTDVMTPLGTLSNLLNPAVAKGEKTKRQTPEERKALIEANLGQLKRAVAYWTGDESAADKINLNLIESEMNHVHDGGRVARAFAISLVRLTAVPRGKQENIISALTNRPEFTNLLRLLPEAPQHQTKEQLAPEISERARALIGRTAQELGYTENPDSVWEGPPPTDPQIRLYLDRANEYETGLLGVAMRVMHKAGALDLIKSENGPAFKFPSDALSTQLRGAQNFYAIHTRPGRYIMDMPFKTDDGSRRSVGYSASKLLFALSPDYEDMRDGASDLPQRIDAFRSDISALADRLAERSRKPLNNHQRGVLVGILDSLTPKAVQAAYKEALKIAREQRRGDERVFEEARTAAEAGGIPRMPSEPVPPDNFARLQTAFSNILLTELKSDRTTLKEFLTDASKGYFTEFKMAGVWRDHAVAEMVESLENDTDMGRERARVEQLINNLPKLAEQAGQKRRGESPERKFGVRLIAQALYEMVAEIREKRLRDSRAANEGEKTSSARETSTQQQEFARTYRMFVEYGLIQPRSEPLESPERLEGQTDAEYDTAVMEAVTAHERESKMQDEHFRAERKNKIFEHLLNLFDHLDDAKSLSGNMSARIGEILGKKGAEFKKAVREKMQEIEARPPQEHFSQKQKPASWNWKDWDPYVVYDQKTGKLLQPPEQMRESITKAEQLVSAAKESLAALRLEFEELRVKVSLPEAPVDEIDVNKLIVIEDKARDPFTLLVLTQEALKRFGTDRDSRAYRATVTTIDRLNGVVKDIRDMRKGFDSMRKDLLLKFVRQIRSRLQAEGKSEEENKDLLAQLAELELAARNGSPEDVRQGINFFMYTE
ncbi:hypothetical protein A2765_05745 [Candidatus Kaiserbacteria bacterium RIFCSPHIGHO2_01_FULL_56_24]|uniref:Uncharacterized protein n=1 Tax=Candidatus Kaiserbacteria bacterium RIFCSPHIGHO2_01_FULL_56_24 TaxID=1798487 RepID=A0A1F6DBM1_9BACT|nr:MAG: hypothetical protein A2765_05745 [Candidatus Kaiserbacteria bacterium RIFCSPHIGHO2_01_FULL_56_24]